MAELLRGRLQSGKGDASHWLQLFNLAYSRKLQMPVYPGSLNLALEHTFDWFAVRYQAHIIWFGREEYGASATFSSCHANWWTSSAVRRSYGRLPRRLGADPTPGLLNLFVTSSFGKPTACRTGTYSPLSSPYNMGWQRKALYPTTPWKA